MERTMAKGTKFYLVSGEMDTIACETLEMAKSVRRLMSFPYGAVTQVEVPDLPIRQMLCAVYNHQGFASVQTEIIPGHPCPPILNLSDVK
jgi:hypothetical protein